MHHRRSIRLKDYDYRQNGAYFVTICSHERLCLFGAVADGEMALNEWGGIIQACWNEIPAHYPMVELDGFVVMPNHVHGIVVITGGDDVNRRGMIYHAPTNANAPTNTNAPTNANAPTNTRAFSKPIANSLSSMMGTFKAAVTRHIRRLMDAPDHPIWQRNYYEHIIRNEQALNTVRAYVVNNPAKWAEDSLYME
jgi:REP element-mobilizing transposase RayT